MDDFLVGAPSTSVSLGLTRNEIEMTIDVTRERIAAEARPDVAAASGASAFPVSLPLCRLLYSISWAKMIHIDQGHAAATGILSSYIMNAHYCILIRSEYC